MIRIKNVKTLSGQIQCIDIESDTEEVLDAEGQLTLLPALIDLTASFEIPGHAEREDWISGARAAIAGGVSTVCDLPFNTPPTVSAERLKAKKEMIDKQLSEVDIPLRHRFWFGIDSAHIHEAGMVKHHLIGMMIDTDYLMQNEEEFEETLDRAFQVAAQHDLIIGVHAEDPSILERRKGECGENPAPNAHSKIHCKEAALKALDQMITQTEKFAGQLFVPQISTREEIQLIQEARQREILIYTGVSPRHLFLDKSAYAHLGGFAVADPPLRSKEDQYALWEALDSGFFDIISSGHRPKTREEKSLPYPHTAAGSSEIETMLPLLLNAVNEGRLTLDKVARFTSIGPQEIFRLKKEMDYVLVDLEAKNKVHSKMIKSKSGWSPYEGMVLQGWPKYTIICGRIFEIDDTL